MKNVRSSGYTPLRSNSHCLATEETQKGCGVQPMIRARDDITIAQAAERYPDPRLPVDVNLPRQELPS